MAQFIFELPCEQAVAIENALDLFTFGRIGDQNRKKKSIQCPNPMVRSLKKLSYVSTN